ncbi:MAG: DUF4959 domain-containing protein [Bacteroidales bacterium]|jgi:hypothetical protein|nr:DUF4959 domain-containing protein [Bacteroidales bacterium]
MKKINYLVILLTCMAVSCKEKTVGDTEPPAKIEHYTVTEINGGAVITYAIPDDHDIKYVMAEYERNGETFRELTSVYRNSIRVEGFNTMEPVKVKLFTVNYGEILSEPTEVEFTPLESPISLSFQSLQLAAAFSGLSVSWENQAKIELGVRLMYIDSIGMLKNHDMFFSSNPVAQHTFKKFKNVETTFAVSLEDKWGNITDTVYYTTTPFYEDEAKKPFPRVTLPYDNVSNYSAAFAYASLFDGIVAGQNSWLTASGSAGCSFTFDLKEVYKLSQMILWPRMRDNIPADVYTQVNVLVFEMWGTKYIDPALLPPADQSYWLDDFTVHVTAPATPIPTPSFKDHWVYLGRYEVERLDLKGATATDIATRAKEGNYFDLPLEAEPVRYIRFFPRTTAGGSPPPNNYWQITEMSFFGDNHVPQE